MSETLIVPEDVAELAQRVAGHDGSRWAHQCHAASIQIVQSGIYPGARVARGHAGGVGLGQHSWIVLPQEGEELADCYNFGAQIIDPTLWSYDESVKEIWTGRNGERHIPQGVGFINPFFRLEEPPRLDSLIEVPDELANTLSYRARDYLLTAGYLNWGRKLVADAAGWMTLCHQPVQGWPSAEIINVLAQVPEINVFIPIDIVGMLTDRNPSGLYLQGEEK